MKNLKSNTQTSQNELTAAKCSCGESDSDAICITCDLTEVINRMMLDFDKEHEILESLEDESDEFYDFEEYDFEDFDEIEMDEYDNESSFRETMITETIILMPYPNYTTTFWRDIVINYNLKIDN
jgi:hypothetical protein